MKISREEVLRFYGWSENPTIWECAEKAYLDLARPLKGIGNMNQEKKRVTRRVYMSYMCQWIAQCKNAL